MEKRTGPAWFSFGMATMFILVLLHDPKVIDMGFLNNVGNFSKETGLFYTVRHVNLIKNPSFENNESFWLNCFRDDQTRHSGNYSARCHWGDIGNSLGRMDAEKNTTYRFGVWMKADSNGSNRCEIHFSLYEHDPGDNIVKNYYTRDWWFDDVWREHAFEFTTGTNTTWLELFPLVVGCWSNTQNPKLWLDDFNLTAV